MDKSAGEELDGLNLSDEELDTSIDIGRDEEASEPAPAPDLDNEMNLDGDTGTGIEGEAQPPQQSNQTSFTVNNVKDQLNGMVEKWFQLAQDMDPAKKESFLKLGDRLSEITDVIESEFMNA